MDPVVLIGLALLALAAIGFAIELRAEDRERRRRRTPKTISRIDDHYGK